MKQITLFAFIFCSLISTSQNLVLNPSFEDFFDCPLAIGFFDRNVKNWTIPSTGTTDYFNNCSEAIGFQNFNGYQEARTGKGYAGIYTYFKKDYREYIQGSLTSKLERGKKYQVKFYISLAENSRYALKEFGIMFTSTKANFKANINIYAKHIAKRHPRLTLRSTFNKEFYDNDKEWVEVSFTYTAQGFENYFAIGNFNNNSDTKKSKARQTDYESFSYYYIDDISIEPLEKEILTETTETVEQPNLKVNEVYTFKNVLFEFDKAELLTVSKEELNQLYKHLKAHPKLKVEIYGHTDNVGLETRNQELSEQRAKAAEGYLILQGLSVTKIKSFGFGSTQAISSNETEEGRLQNRRVTFKLIQS
ncbi:OmpA family protein [Winogradskyella undariae]|uniref:OmpA family protein n=1 Tax=Winogradskyella undariae TaxID=1285465 RepID=UPI00156AB28B|nr:OmpA family protein [Winogradskyella undariae]NRR91331.1 OmpA family protein [Winogradskyella undariae]